MATYEVGQEECVDGSTNCSSCKDEGLFIVAVRYCVDCEEYQCKKCFKCHERYTNQGHEVYDGSSKQKWGSKKRDKLPKERCPTHVGEVLQIYCGDHDALCCHVCVAMGHSACRRKQYIPELAKDITTSNEEFTTLQEALDKMEKHVQQVTRASLSNKQSIMTSRETCKRQLRETRQRFEQMYFEADKHSSTKINTLHDSIDAEVSAKLTSGNELLAELRNLRARIDSDSVTSDSQLYINMKQVKRELEQMQGKVERVSEPQPTGIQCQTTSTVNNFLNIKEGLLETRTMKNQGTPTDNLQWRTQTLMTPTNYHRLTKKKGGNRHMYGDGW